MKKRKMVQVSEESLAKMLPARLGVDEITSVHHDATRGVIEVVYIPATPSVFEGAHSVAEPMVTAEEVTASGSR